MRATRATPGPVIRLYELDDDPVEKVRKVATTLYGAADVQWEPAATRALARFVKAGYGRLPVCIAKSNLALSHDPSAQGRADGLHVPGPRGALGRRRRFSHRARGQHRHHAGAAPGSRYAGIDVGEDGQVVGLR